MKFLIFVRGQPLVHGYKRLEFVWSQAHKLYLYLGREIEASELDALCDKVFIHPTYRTMFPSVHVAPGSVQDPAPVAADVTLAKALEVVEELAPHMLKKKPGPRPELVPA